MRLLKIAERRRRVRRADLPWLGPDVLVLRDEAVDVVGPLLQPHGELLPLRCDEARLVVFSAPVIAGALDEDRSDLIRFSSGRIMDMLAPAFRVEVLGGVQAFKLAEMPRGCLYLREELVDAIRTTGRTSGTDFKVVFAGRVGQ